MALFRQGISEHTVDRHSVHAKESTQGNLIRSHTKVTGSYLTALLKFCLDVCAYTDPANPLAVKRSDIPEIRNVTTPVAVGAELTITLPLNLQQINIKAQASGPELQIRTTSASAAYYTIPADGSLTWDNLNLTAARNLYISSDSPSTVIEIWEWT